MTPASEYTRRWRQSRFKADPAAFRAYRADEARKRRARIKANREIPDHLRTRYPGIYAPTLTCEACASPFDDSQARKMCADHDHTTGRFRGWLCNDCNLALGYAQDSQDRLSMLISYLDKTGLRAAA